MSERDEDGELLTRVALRQDSAAFVSLMERHQQALLGMAYYLTRNRDSAEEALQEALLRAWRHAGRFKYRGAGSVRAWLLKLTANESIRLARLPDREARRIERAETCKPAPPAFPAGTSIERQELVHALRAGLDELSGVEREVVGLYFGADLDQHTIAKQLNLSQQVISYKLKQALNKLRSGLSQGGFASALPLLETPLLGSVLQTWTTVSPTWAGRIREAPPWPQRPSGRAALGSWGAAAGAAVFLAAGVAATLVWWVPEWARPASPASTSSLTAPQAPPASQQTAQAVPAAGRQKFYRRHWDFNDPAQVQADFTLKTGFAYQPAGSGPDTGCLKTTQSIGKLLLEGFPTDHLPLRVRFKQQLLSAPADRLAKTSCGWTDTSLKAYGVFYHAGALLMERQNHSAWRQVECYLSEHFTDTWLNGKRSNIEYVELLERRQLVLYTDGEFRIDDLEIEQLPPDAIPEVGPFEAAIAAIPLEGRRDARYDLPGLSSPRPGEKVQLRFLPCPGWIAKDESRRNAR